MRYYEKSKKSAIAKVDRTKKDVSHAVREFDKNEGDTSKIREALDAVRKDEKDRRQLIHRIQKEIDEGTKAQGERPPRPESTAIKTRLVSCHSSLLVLIAVG